MTQVEKIEFNKMCAEILGARHFAATNEYELYGIIECIDDDVDEQHFFEPQHMKFDTDWRWLMHVVEKIESIYDDFHGYFGVHISSNNCTIQGTKLRTTRENFHPAYFSSFTLGSKIESTVQAINIFLIWYNENKVN